MAARTKTKVSPKYKTKYRVKNWPAYDIALRDRGDITVWFDVESICAWNAPPSGRPGGQRRYSDLAIVTALTLRTVFHLPLRQTEGFVASLIGLMGLALQTPDQHDALTTSSQCGGSAPAQGSRRPAPSCRRVELFENIWRRGVAGSQVLGLEPAPQLAQAASGH